MASVASKAKFLKRGQFIPILRCELILSSAIERKNFLSVTSTVKSEKVHEAAYGFEIVSPALNPTFDLLCLPLYS